MRSQRHAEPTQLLIQFLAGPQPYLARLDTVSQVERLRRVEPLAGAPEWLDGILPTHRGPLPLLSFAAILDAHVPPPHARARVLIVETGRRRIALRTDGSSRVVTVPNRAIEPPPADSRAHDWVVGVATFLEQVVMIIDPRRVVSQERLDTLGALLPAGT